MAKELKPLDITHTPELLRLADEVQRTRQPRILRRQSEDVAIVLPVTARSRALSQEQAVEAEIWADIGLSDPSTIWDHYDAARVQAALEQARGALSGTDRDELQRDLTQAREQRERTRPH